jgi:hypothetical protein
MLAPILNNNKPLWNINLLLKQDDDVEIEDDDEQDEEETGEKENTPDLKDDIFNEEHSAMSVELF